MVWIREKKNIRRWDHPNKSISKLSPKIKGTYRNTPSECNISLEACFLEDFRLLLNEIIRVRLHFQKGKQRYTYREHQIRY